MSSWHNIALSQIFHMAQSFQRSLNVPDDFHGQMKEVKRLLKQDDTGLIVPILNFQIRAANVDINFDGSTTGLTKLFNDWKQEVNKDLNVDIPRGLKNLSENYYRERWKSSFIVLRMIWEDFNGYLMPMKMWIMDGASIYVQNKDLDLAGNEYFLGEPKKSNQLVTEARKTLLIRKPYNQNYDQEPTPYLVGNGALKHKLRFESLTNHQNEMLMTAFSYQLLLKMGSDSAQARGDNPQVKDLINLLTQFQELKEKIDIHTYARGLAGAFSHDVKLEEFIPDFKKIMDESISKPVLQRVLSSMGMIELKGFSSTREEAILNPKVLVEETVDAVLDYTDLLQEVVAQIQEKNKDRYKINDKVVIQPGIIKAFLTKDDKQMIRSWYDRGLVGDKSGLENTTDLLFERQIKERDYERKEGLDLRMFCRVVQNQDNGVNDIPNHENNSPDKTGPEKNNYKNATQLQENIDKANQVYNNRYITCQHCKEQIEYLKYPEVRMGYIKCPNCNTEIDQDGNYYANEIEQAIEKQYIDAPYTKDNYPSQLKNLPIGARNLWIQTFNTVLKDTGDEDRARQAAWYQVKQKYYKDSDGTWKKKKD